MYLQGFYHSLVLPSRPTRDEKNTSTAACAGVAGGGGRLRGSPNGDRWWWATAGCVGAQAADAQPVGARGWSSGQPGGSSWLRETANTAARRSVQPIHTRKKRIRRENRSEEKMRRKKIGGIKKKNKGSMVI
jgi:hypothetical protein